LGEVSMLVGMCVGDFVVCRGFHLVLRGSGPATRYESQGVVWLLVRWCGVVRLVGVGGCQRWWEWGGTAG